MVLISNNKSSLNKLYIMGPGFQCLIETDRGYDEYVAKINEDLQDGKTIVFRAIEKDMCSTVVFKPSVHTPVSIVVMNDKAFENYKREQMFAAQRQALSEHGRNV